jgi:hypothetical protein
MTLQAADEALDRMTRAKDQEGSVFSCSSHTSQLLRCSVLMFIRRNLEAWGKGRPGPAISPSQPGREQTTLILIEACSDQGGTSHHTGRFTCHAPNPCRPVLPSQTSCQPEHQILTELSWKTESCELSG